MKTATTQTSKTYRRLGTLALSAVLAGLIGGMTAVPARADDDDRGRNVQQERHERARHPVRHTYRHEPSYVYAPPPVYYAPPPRQPVIDFIFPLNIR
jgi:hypothetical protein